MLALPPVNSAQATATNPWLTDARSRIVRVRAASVVRISWPQLIESGWELAEIPTGRVQVWRQGVQVPIQVDTIGISFRAEPNQSPVSMEAAYWLVVGAGTSLRGALPIRSTQTLSWHPDLLYQSLVPTARGDRWFAGELRTGNLPMQISLNLPATLPAGAQVVLSLTPFELRNGHQIQLWHGSVLVGSSTWDDPTSGPRTLSLVTSTTLPAGHVALTLALSSSGTDIVLIDEIALPEAHIPLPAVKPAVERLHTAPMLIAADQLIIAHPDLIPALAPLIRAKQQRGRSLAVADVLAIYDTYSWGERAPEAIRAFVQAMAAAAGQQAGGLSCHAHSSPCLESVLLLGAGSARMRVGPDEDDPTLVPPYLLDADGTYGEIACDTCYARLDTPDPQQDLLPDLALGRIPARTLAEAEVMITKTVSALNPPAGEWRSRLLLAADNDRDAMGLPDPAGPFTELLGMFTSILPALRPTRFVYAPDQASNLGPYRDAPILRDRLLSDWDAGAALIAYVGHASAWQWAWTGPQEPVAHLLARSDAVRKNNTRLPILLSMTCLSGSFANPTLTAIDEELLRQPGGGIVAALSPTGSGVNTGHASMLAGILPALEQGESLGAAHLAGLRELLATQANQHLAFSYGILGDPDVALPTASVYRVALALVYHG